jgi:hypothetical protein
LKLRRRGFGRGGVVDEQIPAEEVMPRELVDHPDRQPIRRVGAREAVEDEQFLVLERSEHLVVQDVELRRVNRPVDLAPCDLTRARRLADDEFVVGRAAGMQARPACERPVRSDQPFPAPDRFFVQRGGG